MGSIIDEIAGAEAQAEGIRQDAITAAKEAAAQEASKFETQRAEAAKLARERLRSAAQKAEEDGAALAERIRTERAAETQAQCTAARSKVPETATYLLRRVVNAE